MRDINVVGQLQESEHRPELTLLNWSNLPKLFKYARYHHTSVPGIMSE